MVASIRHFILTKPLPSNASSTCIRDNISELNLVGQLTTHTVRPKTYFSGVTSHPIGVNNHAANTRRLRSILSKFEVKIP